jgi:hypothetical protein
MRTTFTLLAALLTLLIAATPAAAHHGKGSHARDSDDDGGRGGARSERQHGPSEKQDEPSEKQDGPAACNWDSDADGCPGNSGWAHWCKDQHGPGRARGQCVAEHARAQGQDLGDDDGDDDNGNDNDGDDGQHGNLHITEISVADGGSFRVQGEGAEGAVTIRVGGLSGQVVGFGQGDANNEGRFDITGMWACHDDDERHEARVRAQDADERDSERATFPCDEEE